MMRYSPSTQLVEKKQIFWVSRGFSLVKSEERDWGSDSPVKEELSTWDGREDRSWKKSTHIFIIDMQREA